MDSDATTRGLFLALIGLGMIFHFAKKYAQNNPDVAQTGKDLLAEKLKGMLKKRLG